jgi:threonine/homoserine/homoserine lactone efflux protein
MSLLGLLTFAGVYFVFVMSPGPGVAATIARGLGAGTANAFGYVAGFVLGDLIWFTIAATGLAALATQFGTAFLVLKYLGCAYLLYLAWKFWVSASAAADVEAATHVPGQWSGFVGTLTLTLSNPKVIVFFLSIMPLAVDVKSLTLSAYLSMAAIMAVVCSSCILVVLVLAARARRVFRSPVAITRINRASAGLLAGAAMFAALKA